MGPQLKFRRMTEKLGVLLLGLTPEHTLSARAVEIWTVFGFSVINSMVVSWVIALGLIVFARLATRRMEEVPGGIQKFLEWLIESLYNFLEGLLGKHLVDRTFWFFATVFIFILSANWLGLVPGSLARATSC
jgi:F-type H+-transporting ATPase subunit a